MTKKQIAFLIKLLTPYLSTLAGVIATFLVVHVHLLGMFHSKSQVANIIVQLLVLALVTVLTWITAHTKIIPEIEKWAGQFVPALEPIVGHIVSPAAVTVHAGSGTVAITSDGGTTVTTDPAPKI
jgi:hypothetical protein